MTTQLFIPKKIKVGYQKREDTYTKKLAYIIYYDTKGVLRKETSWEGWRHKDIDPEEFDNTPHSGFILNKDVKRSSEWFGNGRNMIRIYDDRGIEFEITTGNLLFILMTTNCHKRGLEGEFVYAWQGTELVLLPTGCEEYEGCMDYTSLQAGKISAKSLIAGASYKTKKQENLIYLGKYDWFTFSYPSKKLEAELDINQPVNGRNRYDSNYMRNPVNRINDSTKYYIFLNEENKYTVLAGLTSLAAVNTDIPVSNYAELMETFSNSRFGSKVVGIENENIPPSFTEAAHGIIQVSGTFLKIADNTYHQYRVNEYYDYRGYDHATSRYIKEHRGYQIDQGRIVTFKDGRIIEKDADDLTKKESSIYDLLNNYVGRASKPKFYNEEEIGRLGFTKLYVKLESGSKIPFEEYSNTIY